jgi:hypothetical protein
MSHISPAGLELALLVRRDHDTCRLHQRSQGAFLAALRKPLGQAHQIGIQLTQAR